MSDGGNTIPRITKAEHIGPLDTGDNIEAKRVAVFSWDGGSAGWSRQGEKTERYDIQGTIIYVGEALIGTAEATITWTITKYNLTDLTQGSGKVVLGAAWTTRASEVYA